jgi:hypothetical protein
MLRLIFTVVWCIFCFSFFQSVPVYLGHLRHAGGLIPWDYDHDVGMTSDQFHKFISVVEKLKAEMAAKTNAEGKQKTEDGSIISVTDGSASKHLNLRCTFDLSDFIIERSGDRGYYVMSLVSHPDIQIDIVEYITVSETDPSTGASRQLLKHNMDDATYEGFFYPDYPIEWVYPLRKVNMLGFPTLIPNDADAVTRSHFGSNYMQSLWIPYILTKLYNPIRFSTLWEPPVREVPVVGSYTEGFRLFGCTSPFMVRRPDDFAHITVESLTKFAQSSDKECFGYDSNGEVIEGLLVRDVIQQWQSGLLNAKVLDSPLQCAQLPEEFIQFDVQTEEENTADTNTPGDSSAATAAGSSPGVVSMRNASQAGLGLMVTRANAYTFCHVDPPTYGGGWMYLCGGMKVWYFIHPDFIPPLYDSNNKRLMDLPISELIRRYGSKLHGKIYQCTARSGDLTYFPPSWIHRVRTYEKCIGVSGYMKLKQAHPLMNTYADKLDALGLSSIWNGNADI